MVEQLRFRQFILPLNYIHLTTFFINKKNIIAVFPPFVLHYTVIVLGTQTQFLENDEGTKQNLTKLSCFQQHIVLGIKFAVAYAIPDVPEWVEVEIAKVEWKRRTALKVRVHNTSNTKRHNPLTF